MYNVSNDYINKMLDEVQTHHLHGTIDGVSFTENDVIGVSYSNQCADKNVVVGSAAIGTFKITFLKDILNRGEYYDKQIIVYDSLVLGLDENDQEITEDVLVGTFWVAEAQWTAASMIDITAYDVLSKLDKNVTFSQSSARLYGWLSIIATECDVTVGMTQEECEALTNGALEIAVYEENQITTYRDLLSALGQTVGGFGYATRDGGIAVKSFTNTSLFTIPKVNRFNGASFSDFSTRFDAISFADRPNETTWIEGDEDGYIMNLGDAPFLQYGSPDARQAMAQALLAQVQEMSYVPCKVQLLPAFIAFDLGDVITCTNDHASEDSLTCVMSISWQYNKSVAIQCFGSNPNLKNAKSKTDNAVTGASRYGGGSKLSTFVATNGSDIVINTIETEITRANFTVADNACALALFECKFEIPDPNPDPEESGPLIELDETVTIHYYIDGHAYDYVPTEHFNDPGLHTISLMLPIVGASSDSKHTLVVRMKSSNGGDLVNALDSRLYIQSTGAAGEARWDGWIRCDDEMHLIPLGNLGFLDYTDTTTVTTYESSDPDPISDTIEYVDIGYITTKIMTDVCNVYMEGGFGILLEQNDEVLRTDQDVRLITE